MFFPTFANLRTCSGMMQGRKVWRSVQRVWITITDTRANEEELAHNLCINKMPLLHRILTRSYGNRYGADLRL